MAVMVDVKTYKMFIGGEWVDAAEGGTVEIINPANGQAIAVVPNGTAADVDRAVEAAKRALPGWLETTPGERSLILLKMADALEQNIDEIGAIESANAGKPKLQATHDLELCVDVLRFYAGAARHLDGISAGEYLAGYTSYIRREPIGIVAGIAPWNYPLAMAVFKFAPALAAGNVQITKPSEQTPLSLLKFAELTQDLLPAGVFNVVTGDGIPVGERLVSHPDVYFVSLTGDVSTGKAVARIASDTLTRTHLELGGKAPVVIFDDADLESLQHVLKVGSYYNAGQDCTAACRILAGPKVFDEVVSGLVDTAKGLKVGDPSSDPSLDIGSLISTKQQQRVLGFLDRAQDANAEILTGGETLGTVGSFVTPAVVVGVDQSHEIVQKEVFGPVATVQRFSTEEEAYEWANATRYGLAASVFTENHARAMNASRRLEFGCVWVNDHWLASPELPHGGFKQSGYGNDMSRYGFEDYTQIKQVTHRVGPSVWSIGQAGLTTEGRNSMRA